MIQLVKKLVQHLRRLFIPLLILITLAVWVFVFKLFSFTYISGEFQDLRPIHRLLPVYYKGLRIGDAYCMHHGKDFVSTFVHFVLYPKELKLPQNMQIVLKKEKRKRHERDFFELIYPEKPSALLLRNGELLIGRTTIDMDTYLANQDADSLDAIKKNLAESAENLNVAVAQLGQMFALLNGILEENQGNINAATRNLAKTTGNVSEMSKNINTALSKQRLENLSSNLDATVGSVKVSTANLEILTKNLDGTTTSINETIPQISRTLPGTQCIVDNISAISCGIRQTLRKRFGGLRLIFGQAIQCDCQAKNCCP